VGGRGPTSKEWGMGRKGRGRKGREGCPKGWLTPHVSNPEKYPAVFSL